MTATNHTEDTMKTKSKPTATNLRRRAARLGADVEFRQMDHGGEWVITAPPGHIFSGTDLHECVAPYGAGSWGGGPASDAIARLLRDMERGVEPCTDESCDWCGRG